MKDLDASTGINMRWAARHWGQFELIMQDQGAPDHAGLCKRCGQARVTLKTIPSIDAKLEIKEIELCKACRVDLTQQAKRRAGTLQVGEVEF